MRSNFRRWTGLIASFVSSMLAGLFLAFNVYAVELKRTFDLNQTKVELIGSFAIAGASTGFIGALIIKKFGYRACYVTAWIVITSSCVLTWLTTLYVDIFREWVSLLCALSFLLTAGLSNAQTCCLAIGILQFPNRRTGTIIGFYMALVCLGKIYYSVLYQLFFQTDDGLGRFFLFTPVGISISLFSCFLFHVAPNVDPQAQELLADHTEERVEKYNCKDKPKPKAIPDEPTEELSYPTGSQVLRSCFIHMIVWPNMLFQACALSFMNNVTTMASSLNIDEPKVTIYILAVGIAVSRISFGVIYDHFGTKLSAIVLFQICYITFAAAMVIGLTWFTSVSIYIMAALTSVGVGAVYTLTLGLLTAICGPHRYILVYSVYAFGVSFATLLVQFLMGMTYDHTFEVLQVSTFLCAECFFSTFVILLCCSVFSVILQGINLFCIGD